MDRQYRAFVSYGWIKSQFRYGKWTRLDNNRIQIIVNPIFGSEKVTIRQRGTLFPISGPGNNYIHVDSAHTLRARKRKR